MLNGPRLNLIRAFVSVAQHGNIKDAAETLNTTQSALSRKIKLLESELKVDLFTRLPRGVRLSEAGQLIYADCERGMSLIDASLGRISPEAGRTSFRVACARSFATRILSHRIANFYEKYPWIEMRIDGYRHLSDLHEGQSDIAIRVGDGYWSDLEVIRLCVDPLVPVCSPHIFSELNTSSPQRLIGNGALLLHFSDHPYWQQWARHFHAEPDQIVAGPVFSETVMMLEAAEAGQGIALGRSSLVAESILDGRLVKAGDYVFDDGISYYLLSTPKAAKRKVNRIFTQWLFDEIVPRMELR